MLNNDVFRRRKNTVEKEILKTGGNGVFGAFTAREPAEGLQIRVLATAMRRSAIERRVGEKKRASASRPAREIRRCGLSTRSRSGSTRAPASGNPPTVPADRLAGDAAFYATSVRRRWDQQCLLRFRSRFALRFVVNAVRMCPRGVTWLHTYTRITRTHARTHARSTHTHTHTHSISDSSLS